MKKLFNVTDKPLAVLDVAGNAHTVPPGESCEFTPHAARELVASFPSDWSDTTPPQTSAAKHKRGK